MSDPTNDSRLLNILGERVALGPLRRDLIPLYTRWVNDLPARVNLGSPAPMTCEQEEEWYDSTIKAGNQAHFNLYEREGPQPIGTAGRSSASCLEKRSTGTGATAPRPPASCSITPSPPRGCTT